VQERENAEGIVLVLDAGSALGGGWVALKSKGRVIVEAMDAMGYDALTIGRMDMALGLEDVQERAKEAGFPFLSANIVDVEGEPLFAPYTILERGGRRIGILGLSEENANLAPGMTGLVEVLDYSEATARYVSELRGQVDLLIVLSHLGLEEDKLLAGEVSGIDIIIGGNTRKLMPVPERVGDTLIIQQGYLGEWMGKLTASYDGAGQLVAHGAQIITLGPEYADDPLVAELVDTWRARYPTPTRALSPTPEATPTP
jgi:2',3'-cyclic-nucleotide 2'-phosphodiesterase (5'-nucleotidase family)